MWGPRPAQLRGAPMWGWLCFFFVFFFFHILVNSGCCRRQPWDRDYHTVVYHHPGVRTVQSKLFYPQDNVIWVSSHALFPLKCRNSVLRAGLSGRPGVPGEYFSLGLSSPTLHTSKQNARSWGWKPCCAFSCLGKCWTRWSKHRRCSASKKERVSLVLLHGFLMH